MIKMKFKNVVGIFLIFIFMVLIISPPATAQMSSTNSAITTSVESEAGGDIQSSQFKISPSAGQSGVIGTSSSANFALAGGFLSQAFAEIQTAAALILPETIGLSGSTVLIPISVSTDSGIGIAQFIVEYDSLIIKFINAQVGAGATGFIVSQINDNLPFEPSTSGTNENVLVQISGGGQASFSGDSVEVVLLEFDVVGDNGTTVLAFDAAVSHTFLTTVNLTDIFGSLIDFVNGSFTVQPGYSVSGKVKYYSNEASVSNVVMTLDGNSVTTDGQGEFLFPNVAAGEYVLLPSKDGDVNDGISAYDGSFILQDVVGLIDLTPYQMIAADVTGNGEVTSYDAAYILQYVVGLINEFPVGSDWFFVPTDSTVDENTWKTAPNSITYAPLNADQTDQDFNGIVYGDVSGNWAPGGGELANLYRKPVGTATLDWGEIANIDKRLTIPVRANIEGDLYAAQFKICYDAEQLSFENLRLGKNCEGSEIAFNDRQGEIIVAMAGARSLSSEIDLMILEFRLKDREQQSGHLLKIEQAVLNEGSIQVGELPLLASLKAILPKTTQLFQNFPNPFNPVTAINYQLNRSTHVRFKIFDLLGKEVVTLVNKRQEAGSYSVIWDGRDKSGHLVASGIYLYQLKTDEYMATRKLLFIR